MEIVQCILITLESCFFPPASRFIIPVQELKDFCYATCFLWCCGVIDFLFQERVQFTAHTESMISDSRVFRAGGGGRGQPEGWPPSA
ncbi:hypothetical protein BM536_038395 [Streptomyces phaeoluteigriseus]|uniref:Uncharacterized protein n=1 Tax=Streptomyces phaeoluteigriseus TaxID=114686 RepID=A0A1V6MHI9_9ACTN|nr:hypothetical protein BM536_038395 [Streptomyces phaeoluteigriseus]